MVVGSVWRVYSAKPRTAAPVKRRLDGNGGMAWTVESQRLSVTRLGSMAGDDPGKVVCQTQMHQLYEQRNKQLL